MEDKFEENIPRIRSIEDLKNERAREIAEKYNLDMNQIPPDYLELMNDIIKNGDRLVLPRDEEVSLNMYRDCIKKLASGMVIIYELIKRDKIKTNFVIKRKKSIEDCETMCYNLQQYMDFFENRQREEINKLVNNP